ncbi:MULTISPECIES: peptidoglycan-binding protein [Thermoanaerobacterium]|uniref:Peptidoglycan-binding domain 1 protein n=2 Tax=Thermoanaerobacterium TaxID=28895 RepID=W9EI89_9THEO|nr:MULTISPECIES: peptidoglycan-binding protein [Thermoanaerobacterium]AFK85431.1 Peptidoglycan-binding domain 1 protein [Thermoanaerobacterium saccharolyticum JW/SL-YS485]ETO39389.1 peptidoglycan-binding domain 1 protein [Thermoanaerobacterium aotearoense SCUT27]
MNAIASGGGTLRSTWVLDNPNTYISKGSTGEVVKQTQQILNKLGYNTGGVDGVFGKNTDAAIRNFQKSHGLTADGIVGPKTLAALRQAADNTSLSSSNGSVNKTYITYNSSGTKNVINNSKIDVLAGDLSRNTSTTVYKTYDKNGKTQTTSFFSVVKNFGEGLGKAVEDTAKGVANVVTHPKEVVKGIEYAVSHPAETVNAIKNETVKTYNEFKNGDANTKAKILGDITGEVALSVIGTKGIDKVAKAVKEVGVIARTAEAAETVDDAAKAEKIVCTVEKTIEASVVKTTDNKIPITNKPNSVVERIDTDGNIIQRRYYDSNGRAVKDIDYTNHGNPNQHPEVPHEHTWDWSNPDKPVRK